MDDSQQGTSPQASCSQHNSRVSRRRLLMAGCAVALSSTQLGCSLFVMAGKMFFGDPVITSDFQVGTGVNLVKSGDRVAVLATAPSAVRSQYPSLELDVQEGVSRRLKREGISVVDPDDVSAWIDNHGGFVDEMDEIATDLEADFLIHFQVRQFTHRETNSQRLFRGQAQGEITVYQVQEVDGLTQALAVYSREFNSRHPRNYAVSAEDRSDVVFESQYLDRFCDELALKFYAHRMGEEVE